MSLNLSSYKLACSNCGIGKKVSAGAVEEFGLLTFRLDCPQCKHVTYLQARSKAARVHDATLELQFRIHDVFADIGPPMTVRQVYYRLSTQHVVEKTDSGYNKVQRELTKMRRAGTIPYEYMSDESRSFFQADTHRNMTEAAHDMAQWYRRDLWAEQGVHVEIWLEKRALTGQLRPICNEFGVRLYPMGGYSSVSFAFEAALELRAIDMPIYIYHLSDLDADGAYSSVVLERELRLHGAQFEFQRLALDNHQVVQYGLQDALREQKRSSTRWRWWAEAYGEDQLACELDAIHPRDLRTMVHNAIQSHIDPAAWRRLQKVEEEERVSLRMWADALQAAA